MRVSVIAALADNGVIGRDGDLPWRLSADLRHFRRLTMGHHLIVGRKTWQSIGKPLPGRTMLVLTRSGRPLEPPGAEAVASLDEALARAAAAGDDEAFIAGGAEVYRIALPRADRLYLTRVHANPAGDVRFPSYDAARWRLVESWDRLPDARNPCRLTFETYDRPAEPSSEVTARPSSSRLT